MSSRLRMRSSGFGAACCACGLLVLGCSSKSPGGAEQDATPMPPAATGASGGSGGGGSPSSGAGDTHSPAMNGGMASGGASGGSAGQSGGAGGSDMVTAPMGKLPNVAQPPNKLGLPPEQWQSGLISPTFEAGIQHNQPLIVLGFLELAGNSHYFFYDISDPSSPQKLSSFVSPGWDESAGPKKEGEAESHQVALARYGNEFYQVTTAGEGVDIWNISNPADPKHVQQIKLQGIAYGDFTEAVWGLAWQGDTIYVGGTSTGLHVLDATNPTDVKFVKNLPTLDLGTVSAGPLWAIGNILVVSTPKENGGIATLDISNPHEPILLHSIKPQKSYIGGFYKRFVFLQDPLRAWDVLSDPLDFGTADAPFATLDTEHSEYMSFSDGYLFLGHALPEPGATKIDVSSMQSMQVRNRIWGRRLEQRLNDDQFSIPVGNLLVLSDDQHPYHGSTIAVHAAAPDTMGPQVDTVLPRDGATGVNVRTRIGFSLTDNLEIATVHSESVIVRPLGGSPLSGKWGLTMGVLNFDPDTDLQPNTTYEVVLPAGGIKDYVGNPIAAEFRSTFTTQ